MSQYTNLLTKRQIFLAVSLFGLLLAVLKLGLDPKAANRQPANFSFPQSVQIPNWQLTGGTEIAPENPKLEEFSLDIYEYQFTKDLNSKDQNPKSLNIGMYYTPGTRGESTIFFAKQFKINSAITPIPQTYKGNNETGYYSLISHQGRSHLVSCINPRGTSTVTSQQFLANRNQYDFQFDRLISTFLGQEAIRDNRCLWVDISMAEDPKIAYPILEKAWTAWYPYWQDKFPQY